LTEKTGVENRGGSKEEVENKSGTLERSQDWKMKGLELYGRDCKNGS